MSAWPAMKQVVFKVICIKQRNVLPLKFIFPMQFNSTNIYKAPIVYQEAVGTKDEEGAPSWIR